MNSYYPTESQVNSYSLFHFFFVASLLVLITIAGCDATNKEMDRELLDSIDLDPDAIQPMRGGDKANTSGSGRAVGNQDKSGTEGPQDSSNGTSASQSMAQSEAAPPEVQAVELNAGVSPWITRDQLPWEAWYVLYVGGKRAGYSHILISEPALENSQRIRIQRWDSVEMMRSGSKSRINIEFESLEHQNGQLISFTEQTDTGMKPVTKEGTVLGKQLQLTTTTPSGSRSRATTAWSDGTWGILGVQAMLMQGPLEPGKIKEGRVFIPQFNGIARVQLAAGEKEVTSLPGGETRELTPVDVVMFTDNSGVKSRNWVDDMGQIIKTVTLTGPNVSTFLAPNDVGKRLAAELEFEQFEDRELTLLGYRDDIHQALRAEYRVDALDVDPYRVLPNEGYQTVRSDSARSAIVSVQHASQLAAEENAATATEPIEAYSEASPWIDFEEKSVTGLVDQLLADLGEQNDTSDLARLNAIAQAVHQRFGVSEMDAPRIRRASQVARQKSGNSIEHAVLLASIFRKLDYPSRIAAGIRANTGDEIAVMQYHAWVEAWVDGQWLPVDSTTGGLANADRIKLLTTELPGNNPYIAVLPVLEKLQSLDRIRLGGLQTE